MAAGYVGNCWRVEGPPAHGCCCTVHVDAENAASADHSSASLATDANLVNESRGGKARGLGDKEVVAGRQRSASCCRLVVVL